MPNFAGACHEVFLAEQPPTKCVNLLAALVPPALARGFLAVRVAKPGRLDERPP